MQQSQQPMRSDGGIEALFDFGFSRFITLSVIKILYILGIVVIALFLLLMIISGFTQGVVSGLVTLIIGPIVALIYLIFLRIWLELVVVIFRIGENTSKLVEIGTGPASHAAVPPPPPPA